MKIYFYAPSNSVDDFIECGIKLLDWNSRTVKINGAYRNCIVGYIHPADSEKFSDPQYIPLKVIVPKDRGFIADSSLYEDDLFIEKPLDLYTASIIPSNDYVFGSYRSPECLITTTILPNLLEKYDRRRDEPLLYESSKDLYLNRLINDAKESSTDFDEISLQAFYNRVSSNGRYQTIDGSNIKAIINKETGEVITIKKL